MNIRKWRTVLCALFGILMLVLGSGQAQAWESGENAPVPDWTKNYIIYSAYDTSEAARNGKSHALFDDGTQGSDGTVKAKEYSEEDSFTFQWKLIPGEEENTYRLKNAKSARQVKAEAGNGSAVSYKDYALSGGEYIFDVVETKGENPVVTIQSVKTDKYLTLGSGATPNTSFTDNVNKSAYWVLEEAPVQEVGDALNISTNEQYIIYSAYDGTEQLRNEGEFLLWDWEGTNEGWLRCYAGSYTYLNTYDWAFIDNGNGSYKMKHLASNRQVQPEGKGGQSYGTNVVSYKNINTQGGGYEFQVQEVVDGKVYVSIQSVANQQYMKPAAEDTADNHVIFTDTLDKTAYWCVVPAPTEDEPSYARLEGAKTLWRTPSMDGNRIIYYRIPAFATANDGTLVAVSDKRYDNANDLGSHQIDLLVKYSEDLGENWSNELNITQGKSTSNTGFGDAAIVADRESDKVLILCVGGSAGYFNSSRSNKIRVNTFLSTDGGKTFTEHNDITEQIYNLDENWLGLFAGSGRIMQSRYIKVGEYYRIYTAISCRASNHGSSVNQVLYSDDFGKNWNILGSTSMKTAPIDPGDEPKVEELPNGDVVVAGRKDHGRFVNIFSYAKGDPTYTDGQWSSQATLPLGATRGTDGETYFLYAKDTTTNEYVYLALQSIPTIHNRRGVGIFWKLLTDQDTTPTAYVDGWNTDNFLLVQTQDSAYSTFTQQEDGKIGFFYEEGVPGYDMVYVPISIGDITKGKYEAGFMGIGSEATPYQVDTEDRAKAVMTVYLNEQVNWEFSEEAAAWMKPELIAKIAEAQSILDNSFMQGDAIFKTELQEKIDEATALEDTAGGSEIHAAAQALQEAIEEHDDCQTLQQQLSQKIEDAQEMLDTEWLDEDRAEAEALTADITEAEKVQSNQLGNKGSEDLHQLIQKLDTSMASYQEIHDLEAELQEEITKAELKKASVPSGVLQTEIEALDTAIAEGNAQIGAGSAEELRQAIVDVSDAISDLQIALAQYKRNNQLETKIRLGEKLLADAELSANSTESTVLSTALQAAKGKLQGTVEEKDAVLKDLIAAIRAYEDACAGNYRAEARYNSYSIQIDASTEKAASYNIYRSNTEDGQYSKITTVNTTAEKNAYVYVDENVGVGVQRWYKVEAVNGNVTEMSDPLTDLYLTGIEAVQQNAEDRQFHISFLVNGDTTFDGERMEVASASELASVSGIMEGTFIISYKPEQTSGRKVLFTVKQAAANVASSGNLDGNTGFVMYQDGTTIRLDASHALFANWTGAAPMGEWSTFGYVNTLYTGTGNNAYTARNGVTSLTYNRADMNGFIGKNQDLSVMTIGANQNNGASELQYAGGIAFVTITDEVLSQDELNKYTEAVNNLIKSGITVPGEVKELSAEASTDSVTLSWKAAEGTVERYEVSMDDGVTWVHVRNALSYTFTELEADSAYTFLVRAVNQVGSGAESEISQSTQGNGSETPEDPEVPETVIIPVFNLPGGVYEGAQSIEITTATEEATIYYTLDGSEPTRESTEYTGPFTITETTTIKTFAVKEGMEDSMVNAVRYEIEIPAPAETHVVAPVFSKEAGIFTSSQKVTITTATEGAKIYYTTSGSTPSQSSKEYTGEIIVDKSMLIKAIAIKDGLKDSDVVTIRYEMEKEWIFTDVGSKDGWRYDAAKYTYNAGIMGENGNGSKKFDTEKNLTRGMFVTVLYRMAGEPSITFEDKFPDVNPEKYYAKAVTWANKNGIVDGKPDGTFGPELNISRAEIAKMLKGYADYCGFDTTAVKDLSTFADGAAVMKSDWKKKALQWATAVNMITGKAGNLAADDFASRVECAQMIRKFGIEYLK